MILNLHSLAFGTETKTGGGTPAWGTEMGQGEGYRFSFENSEEFVTSLVYNSIPDPGNRIYCPLGRGGKQANDYEFVLGSLYDKVYVNGIKIDGKFLLLVVKKLVGANHIGRRTLKYNPRMTLDNVNYNESAYKEMARAIGVSSSGSWFVSDISVRNQDELHFTAHIIDKDKATIFADSTDRTNRLNEILKKFAETHRSSGLSHYLSSLEEKTQLLETFGNYLRAMRTKPFLLLAGISGTGKSRIVKEMAFDSCPDNLALRQDPTSPGNYCLVEVKPNWHDSTELLGYESKIGGSHFVVTPFVKFLAKAMLYEDTPFFVCLDEMNLAPVEQYFAEFLSVLESRKLVGNKITSEPLIKPSIFVEYESSLKPLLFDIRPETANYDGTTTADVPLHYGKENTVYEILKEKGLRIPANVIVVGTVNMDETTHQFSRKVIDRAMTIEMNLPEGDPFMDFYDSRELGYRDTPVDASLYLPSKVSASEALEELAEADSAKTEELKKEIARILTDLNSQLEDTPFKIAYRVQNELVLYFFELWRENKSKEWGELLKNAVDQILMMKVLPRVEGDEDLLEKPLNRLADFCAPYPNATKKVQEMETRLNGSHFTSYWP